jgi:hypothetical protein
MASTTPLLGLSVLPVGEGQQWETMRNHHLNDVVMAQQMMMVQDVAEADRGKTKYIEQQCRLAILRFLRTNHLHMAFGIHPEPGASANYTDKVLRDAVALERSYEQAARWDATREQALTKAPLDPDKVAHVLHEHKRSLDEYGRDGAYEKDAAYDRVSHGWQTTLCEPPRVRSAVVAPKPAEDDIDSGRSSSSSNKRRRGDDDRASRSRSPPPLAAGPSLVEETDDYEASIRSRRASSNRPPLKITYPPQHRSRGPSRSRGRDTAPPHRQTR